jgi:hypothetical protein
MEYRGPLGGVTKKETHKHRLIPWEEIARSSKEKKSYIKLRYKFCAGSRCEYNLLALLNFQCYI